MDILSEGYGIAPTIVMRSKVLTDNAKLLYIQINSFCAAKGFCWVSNEALEELGFGTKSTVGRSMKLLIDNGFIYTEMIKSQSGTTRRIFIGSALPKNGSCALPKNDTSALPKNGSSLYIRKNIRKENIIIDSKESVEKSTNHIDVDNMLKTLKTEVGCSDFAESEVDKRKHGYNLVRLSEKIGEDEFKKRLKELMTDSFHKSNSGRLSYLYRILKGYVPGNTKRSGTTHYNDSGDRSYLDNI